MCSWLKGTELDQTLMAIDILQGEVTPVGGLSQCPIGLVATGSVLLICRVVE
jgi:hypothetical protein